MLNVKNKDAHNSLNLFNVDKKTLRARLRETRSELKPV